LIQGLLDLDTKVACGAFRSLLRKTRHFPAGTIYRKETK